MTTTLHRLLLACALLLAIGPTGVRAGDLIPEDAKPLRVDPDAVKTLRALSDAFVAVNDTVQPAVVSVRSENIVSMPMSMQRGLDEDLRNFFRDPNSRETPDPDDNANRNPRGQRREFRTTQQGSGFIINGKEGYILTNHHVVADAREIYVTLLDRRRLRAQVLGSDADSDIALIKVSATNLPQVALGNDTELKVGEWVVAVGSPFGLNQSVTAGIISAKGRGHVGILEYEDFIQTDAAINPGNSGGPLINLNGEVIAMNTAIASRQGSYDGVGFAIPISMVRTIAEQLLEHGTVTRGYLGVIIQDVNADMAGQLGLEAARGAIVSEVFKGSPAAKAGVAVGDVIVSLDGRPIRDVSHVRNTVSLMGVGREIELGVMRAGDERDLTVTIDQLPADAARAAERAENQTPESAETPRTYEKLGLQVQELTSALADEFGFKEVAGVLISGVADGSPADGIGLQPGQLIMRVGNAEVASIAEFDAAIAAATGGSVLLLLRQGDQQLFVTVPLQ